MTHEWVAGVGSGLPAASIARTRNSWALAKRPAYECGASQAPNAEPSSEHSKVDPASVDEKVKVAFTSTVVGWGAESIVVSGGVVSAGAGETVHVNDAGVGSTLPARSSARTSNVCGPSLRPAYDRGLTHDSNASGSVLSSRHS